MLPVIVSCGRPGKYGTCLRGHTLASGRVKTNTQVACFFSPPAGHWLCRTTQSLNSAAQSPSLSGLLPWTLGFHVHCPTRSLWNTFLYCEHVQRTSSQSRITDLGSPGRTNLFSDIQLRVHFFFSKFLQSPQKHHSPLRSKRSHFIYRSHHISSLIIVNCSELEAKCYSSLNP